ncbi:MAG: hypothetical protein A2Z04_07300 [Chloroflexi bacterium RBG_16_57_9]|nr:MAG: hypothetical protein A2Z04_07300 [Chloroflexi bacterium RBG_16_57_9]
MLLVFFVVMYSSSNADLNKFQALAGSLKSAFGMIDLDMLSGGRSPLSGMLSDLPQVNREFLRLSSAVGQMAREQGLQNSISVNMQRDGIVISVATGVLFTSGSAEVRPDSLKTLDALAALLAPMPNTVRIAGHTDNISPVPDWPSNWELSTARAVAVVKYLAARKVNPTRLSAIGFAEYQPLMANDTPEHRSLNRRVEVLVIYPTQEESLVFGQPKNGNGMMETKGSSKEINSASGKGH